jgi:uroporphyrinogen decarboxylase
MTSVERISRIVRRAPADRIGVFEHFWDDTLRQWRGEKKLSPRAVPENHFGLDMRTAWVFNYVADLAFKEEILEETEETKLVRNGNGAVLRWHKQHASTPEHVDFLVKDRAGWEEHIKPHLLDQTTYRRRINFEWYRRIRAACKRHQQFFCWSGINVFECMHPVAGHEYMLMGMALDPDWVKDMCAVYSELLINLQEILFAEEGKPDGIWYYEDIGFKERPFFSPDMYREIIQPAHRRTFDFAHALGLPVIVHSCGYVAPLIPGLIEAGMDCLQAMEVKAGMDPCALKHDYGDLIAFIGGYDVRHLISNERERIDAELQRMLPVMMRNSGYILHSDHSIPDQVAYETYRYFLERGLAIGTY